MVMVFKPETLMAPAPKTSWQVLRKLSNLDDLGTQLPRVEKGKCLSGFQAQFHGGRRKHTRQIAVFGHRPA